MAADEFVDAEARQRAMVVGAEDRRVGRGGALGGEEELKLAGRFRPERAGAPLVALAMEADARRGAEVEVSRAQITDLLDACARIVEEEQERAVPWRVASAGGQAGE